MSLSDERLGAPGTGVVITGGASGIGLAAAHALAEVGRAVALWDINAEGAKAAAADIAARHGVKALGLAVDLRNPQAVGPAAAETRTALGSVGGIVHGAGTAVQTGIDGVTPENFDAGMALHVRAVISLVRSMADELALEGVRINALSPGMIDTPILGEMRDGMAQLFGPRIFQGRFGRPEEIATAIRFLLSNEASYITAAEIVVDGGIRHSQRP